MIWVIIAIAAIIMLIVIICKWNKHKVMKQFKLGNVIVTGMRGRGKDMLFCIAVNYFKKNYISNVQYSDPKKKYQRFEFDTKVWELAGNDYQSLVDGKIKKYVYPYPDGINYYISDSGIYFPAQYATELCKKYKAAPMFQALSRQLGDCNVNCNTQALGRVWDKIREQSDIYIEMTGCKVIKKWALLKGYIYDDAEACAMHKKPPKFGWGKEGRANRTIYESQNGKIQRFWFITKIPYKYDDRRFKRILENNCTGYGE